MRCQCGYWQVRAVCRAVPASGISPSSSRFRGLSHTRKRRERSVPRGVRVNPSPVGVQGAPGVRFKFGHSRAPCGRCHVTTATRHPASRPLAAKDPPAATQRPIGPMGGDWPSRGVGFGHRPLSPGLSTLKIRGIVPPWRSVTVTLCSFTQEEGTLRFSMHPLRRPRAGRPVALRAVIQPQYPWQIALTIDYASMAK